MKSKLITFIESFVIVMILLVIIQTFMEDFTVLAGMSVQARKALTIAGFVFDLFFTIEFLIRFYTAVSAGRGYIYLTKERGWIDFFASIPLLIFSSGPVVISYFISGSAILGIGGLLNLLKVIKAIRIARVLRFLRIIKIFRNIKYVDSTMAQRHVATITAISITVLVCFLFVMSFVSTVLEVPGLDTAYLQRHAAVGEKLMESSGDEATLSDAISGMQDTEETLLIVRLDDTTLFSRYENDHYARLYTAGDYTYTRIKTSSGATLEYYLDLRPYSMQLARESVSYFLIVILTVLAFLVIYSPHFALTISDPIHVMNRGMSDRDYNLAVKIPEMYADDDIYVLAANYNDVYLPMKDISGETDDASVLSMDSEDIQDILADIKEE